MNESGWLIEFKNWNSYGTFYYGKTITGLGPTDENLDAIRFCRKEDAEAVIGALGIQDAVAVEHL